MPRPIFANPTPGPRYSIACMGDSLTHNHTLGIRPDQFWPTVLEGLLVDAGGRVRVRNFGKSGNTSTQMVDRFANMTTYDVPKLGIIWAGANDPGNAIAGATTQANIESMGETLFDAGTDYLIIGNTQYLNYSSGGDTTSAQSSTYATLEGYQQAAYDTLLAAHPAKVAYCDTYAYMRAIILAGTFQGTAIAQGDFSWHVADSNQHLNVLGNRIVAQAMYETITAQSGWVAALSAPV